jgi:hypothetical protein
VTKKKLVLTLTTGVNILKLLVFDNAKNKLERLSVVSISSLSMHLPYNQILCLLSMFKETIFSSPAIGQKKLTCLSLVSVLSQFASKPKANSSWVGL